LCLAQTGPVLHNVTHGLIPEFRKIQKH
jgi:hypothetical protein